MYIGAEVGDIDFVVLANLKITSFSVFVHPTNNNYDSHNMPLRLKDKQIIKMTSNYLSPRTAGPNRHRACSLKNEKCKC